MHNFSRARIVRNKTKLNWFTYCVLNHDLFSVYPWEYTVMKFAANLNLKEHQFFLIHPVFCFTSTSVKLQECNDASLNFNNISGFFTHPACTVYKVTIVLCRPMGNKP